MSTPVVLIAGDGIGPEVTRAMQEVLAAAGAAVTWVEAHAGLPAVERVGDPLPNETLDQVRRYRVAPTGPFTTPIGPRAVGKVTVRSATSSSALTAVPHAWGRARRAGRRRGSRSQG